MKKILIYLTAALLVLALLSTAVAAEGDDPVKGIFDTLTAEDSSYSRMKEENMQNFEGLAFTEILDGDSFTIEITGSEYMQGSWTFKKDGDYLTVTFPETDYSGAGVTLYVLQAAADYYGLNSKLVTCYINGLTALGIESPEFKNVIDEETGMRTMSIYIAGPLEMKELDQMVLTDDVLNMYGFGPLDEGYSSQTFNLGKINILMNGSVDGVTILLQEYGELDDAALNALTTVVNYMKPAGYEAFVSEYTELKDGQGEGWTVTLNPDEEEVLEIYPDPFEGFSKMIVRLGN